MKPHLTLRHGTWLCRDGKDTGTGYCPMAAYRDWQHTKLLWDAFFTDPPPHA
jgi:hypothetical protein